MKIELIVVIVLLLIFIMSQREGYREMFGFSGHKNEAAYPLINDRLRDISDYQEETVALTHDEIQEIVLGVNKYVSEKLNECTYIIQTLDVKQYKLPTGGIIRVMFMIVRPNGYAYGFAVTADVDLYSRKILGARTQPLGVDAPSDVSAFVSDGTTKEFVKYEMIKQRSLLTRGDFEEVLDTRPTNV